MQDAFQIGNHSVARPTAQAGNAQSPQRSPAVKDQTFAREHFDFQLGQSRNRLDFGIKTRDR